MIKSILGIIINLILTIILVYFTITDLLTLKEKIWLGCSIFISLFFYSGFIIQLDLILRGRI